MPPFKPRAALSSILAAVLVQTAHCAQLIKWMALNAILSHIFFIQKKCATKVQPIAILAWQLTPYTDQLY